MRYLEESSFLLVLFFISFFNSTLIPKQKKQAIISFINVFYLYLNASWFILLCLTPPNLGYFWH